MPLCYTHLAPLGLWYVRFRRFYTLVKILIWWSDRDLYGSSIAVTVRSLDRSLSGISIAFAIRSVEGISIAFAIRSVDPYKIRTRVPI